MSGRLKIDELLLFFVLFLAFLFVSFGKDLLLPPGNEDSAMQTYFELENSLSAPSQGVLANEPEIRVFNPSVELLISSDGGETFESYGTRADLRAIENADITKIPASYHWQQPLGDFPAAKSLVVKLKNNHNGAITEPQVFTWLEEKSTLPVIALTLPVSDLISEKRGLMVFGEQSWEQEGFYETWWFKNANYHGRGTGWERKVFFQFFENNELVTEQYCGLKVSGNATRGFPQKSMQIVARKTYGNDRFDFPFFGEEGRKKYASLVIRNSGNDNSKTLFADLLMQRLAQGATVLTQLGQPTRVYLNGNFWGIYNLRERVDEYFISRVEDVSEDEVTILEGAYAELKDGSEEDKRAFDAITDRLDGLQHLDNFLLAEVERTIDLESFTDYIIFETFYGNTDWPANNAMWYKAGQDGKWKWVLNDLDYGLAYTGSENVNVNLFDRLREADACIAKLFTSLMTNPSFNDRFKIRAAQIVKEHFNSDRVNSFFNGAKNQLQNDVQYQVRRWRMIGSVEKWEDNCNANLLFLISRPEIYLNQVSGL